MRYYWKYLLIIFKSTQTHFAINKILLYQLKFINTHVNTISWVRKCLRIRHPEPIYRRLEKCMQSYFANLLKGIFLNFGGGLAMRMVKVKCSTFFIKKPNVDWLTNLATCI